MVLGDVGRSPRMQYHALSLARMSPNLRVTLLGYAGEHCVPDVARQSNIELLAFTPHLQRLPRKLFLLLAPVKVLLQLLQLLWLLLVSAGSIDLVLLQNPPTIPTFVVVWLCCRLKGAKFVIDWHNLGYSLLALSLGSGHPLVKIAKWVERVFGRKADANLCVTHVMQTWLKDTWRIEATVLHDKPPLFFKPTPLEAQHELFSRVGDQLEHCNDLVTWGKNQANLEETLLTRKTRGLNGKKGKTVIQPRENRPAMIISSTSWTADEDFGILLAALELLDRRTSSLSVSEFPNLLVVVTGKGPQKDMYLEKIKQLAFQRIRIATMWLEASDYPLVLGSADLGVCLHTSSSGLDLPMKVLDMFGCGLPVCAIGFKCLDELVKHEKNGLVFDSSQQLSSQLYDLLKGFPTDTAQLNRLRASLKTVETNQTVSKMRTVLVAISAIFHHKYDLLLTYFSTSVIQNLPNKKVFQNMATPGTFSLGISPEEKLALPLDTLIQKAKKEKPKGRANDKKKPSKGTKAPLKKTQLKKPTKKSHKQQNVKKTVIVPVSKAARAKANAAVASAKRQSVINKRRPGLVLAAKKGKKVVPTVQLRPHKTSAARKQKKKSKQATQGGLDVSNIINHFRTHPKKFDVPKGSNLRITINLNNVKPVVGGQK
ncbi:chitobiosyldiphosphodolichol beta-mannosyltransferase, putative [Phytophthora infestans T30-4]|uniref:Beta-1,4-mannosyltransferase n=2 Tax=Phytophthora infestans TaxID=4787 RepID=D0NI91_PHYIT|nr:chitobiosyldiphosphodolichol beta-mannosyltransferase, putative [Phytophthora infestans T30-4]EEY59176.1 chitobiosyldiphosphodolichol beta-mannosyltransferase, putative [Phytophthora infestans T30-4]|eukprot:XP_002901190.1 chitobiosyldiphosphodolichol beta-mannosyltransferase, putative [Phytophthora infestans T30-4]